jgi:hypothetical protein
MRLKWAIVVVALCVVLTVAAVAYAAMRTTGILPEVIRAQRFEVVDAEAVVRAVLGVSPDGSTELTVKDVTGKARLKLGLQADGEAGLAVMAGPGEARIAMAMPGDGGASLIARDETGRLRVAVGIGPDGIAGVGVVDAQGNVVWSTLPAESSERRDG